MHQSSQHCPLWECLHVYYPMYADKRDFCDIMHQRSINFNNDEEACTFAKHAGLAKFNTLGGATLVAQDQLVGKGVNEVKLGDSLEVRYSAH